MTAHRPLPKAWAVALVALVVVGLSEAGVRLGEDRLGPPQDWYTTGVPSRISDADRIAAEGIESDILFVGTSMVKRGIDVEVVEDRMPTVDQAHNAALPGAQAQVIERWLLEEMVPRVRPTRVVWGISSLDFNGNRLDPVIDAYNSARATRTGWVGTVDRAFAEVSALSRNRLTLRDPASIGSLLGLGAARPAGRNPEVGSDRLMSPVNAREGISESIEESAVGMRERVLVDWVVGPADAEAFRNTLVSLREQGIEVLVVLMPVPDRYVESHPNGEADFAEFVDFVESLLQPLGVPYLDYSRQFPDSDFHDFTHLNGSAARRFSARLADDLTRMGW